MRHVNQLLREQPRKRCGFCRHGKPEHPLCYDERGGKKAPASIRETKLCDDCKHVILAFFTEGQLSVLQSLKPLKEHATVSLWLTQKSIRSTITAAEFFRERKS